MNPVIINKEAIVLAGFSFYGNPFETKDPWKEENEIGRLWQRLITFLQQEPSRFGRIAGQENVYYEVHLYHPASEETGEFEIFVGAAVANLADLPVELVVKILPPTQYALFTLEGEAINSDWHLSIYQEWMPHAGYTSAHPYSFQYYDYRFKGLDRLAESSLDVYVPIK